MATPTQILSDLAQARRWLASLIEKKYQDSAKGCGCCGNDVLPCLYRIVRAIGFRTDLGIFDEVTDKLHSDMMELMGPYVRFTGPEVDAGPNINIQEPTDTATLNGTVTAGDNPINVIEWTQVSGPNTVSITGPNNETATVSGLIPGVYVFRLFANDSVGASAHDTTQVIVAQASYSAHYGYNATGVKPNLGTIEGSPSVPITGNNFEVPYQDNGSPRYYWVAYPTPYPVMNKWSDPDDILNRGNIGSGSDLFGAYTTVGGYRVTITNYPSQMSDIKFEQ